MKKFITLLLLFGTIATLFTACATGGDTSNKPNTVHMKELVFSPTTITIHKGEKVNIVNDVTIAHIIANGTWQNNVPKVGKESGAPQINIQFTGNDSQEIGPFNTAGTFQFYCTVHPGMNLTVIVK
ncbi:cupredoxin domain-containing protein [Ktedonospora formicarum]|uniref:Blue (type 1) copper domain-containing protein n=1 Tax=Ktedonospora formicarum TaxID=2778364 RepID=A0A8J3HZ93_9CHLR|nr:plastocyanin/azurin family copper-binding protein [Ktedonospora formicarum]GHO43248.1 hypothetical protein KSX_14110 [Ktedonospora formicarum]